MFGAMPYYVPREARCLCGNSFIKRTANRKKCDTCRDAVSARTAPRPGACARAEPYGRAAELHRFSTATAAPLKLLLPKWEAHCRRRAIALSDNLRHLVIGGMPNQGVEPDSRALRMGRQRVLTLESGSHFGVTAFFPEDATETSNVFKRRESGMSYAASRVDSEVLWPQSGPAQKVRSMMTRTAGPLISLALSAMIATPTAGDNIHET
jgi:hypothetical protein